MTRERLEELIARIDYEGIALDTEFMTEDERSTLAPHAAKLLKSLKKTGGSSNWHANDDDLAILARLKGFYEGRDVFHQGQWWMAAEVAALALCPWSVVRNAKISVSPPHDAAALKILRDRKPEWLDAWIRERLSEGRPGELWNITLPWSVLRPLIREGVCAKPSGIDYIQRMAISMPNWFSQGSVKPLSEMLLEDKDLLEDEVWRLFDLEMPEFYPVWEGQIPGGLECWGDALRKLSDAGHMDRQRLLDCILGGLFSASGREALSGCIRFYERMEPTTEERAARQQTFLDLLSNPAAHVVTFALNELKTLAKQGNLDAQGFVDGAGPAMVSRAKGHPKTVMALLEALVKRDAGLRGAASLLLMEALVHEAPDVQERAVDLLKKWADPADASMGRALADRLDDVAPSQRPRIEALLAQFGGAVPAKAEESMPATVEAEELLQRAAALPAHLRKATGVDAALAALDQGALPPLPFTVMDANVLTGVDPVVPITDIEELLDAVSHVVERVDSADEVERILDGISRLCDQRPADFQRRTEPLVNRIGKLATDGGTQGLQSFVSQAVSPVMPALFMAWLRAQTPPPEELITIGSHYSPKRFLNARVLELAKRVARMQPEPLLAAPTHSQGWIDPVVLVNRLKKIPDSSIDQHRYDLLQALLRLAPDRRPEALAEANGITGAVGRALRWALGGTVAPVAADKDDAPLWFAAGRCRTPHGRLDELADWRDVDPGPEGVEPARYGRELHPTDNYLNVRVHRLPESGVLATPADWPATALQDWDRLVLFDWDAGWFFDWLGMLWPQNLDGYFVNGIKAVSRRFDNNASTLSPTYVFLRPLLQPDRPWSEIARWLVALGLTVRDGDVRSHAIDALAEAVTDGRAHPEEMAHSILTVAKHPKAKLNRIAEALSEVARLSDLHAYVIAQVFVTWLKAQTELPRDAHCVLEPLLELLTRCAEPLDPAVCAPLNAAQGSSKTGKLAKRLLDLAKPGVGPRHKEFMLGLLQARVERAERWRQGTAVSHGSVVAKADPVC